MKHSEYIEKQPKASKDYYKAFEIADKLHKPGISAHITPDNIKHFRKYLYEIMSKRQQDVATRKIFKASNQLQITRLK